MMSPLISVAPMMDCTDRHDRYFLRLIAPDVQLYTEMIIVQALMHKNKERLLAFHPLEKPVALQLGGCDPTLLALGARMGEEAGYDEINLNAGCPSERVQAGWFGACLMLEPQWVADCVAAMQAKVSIPVTIKCRIGVDQQDSYEFLYEFVRIISRAGCQIFIIHARKAWLSGLSPKQNREIPPLCYDIVRQIKRDFPELTIILNGGIKTITDIEEHLQYVDGVMLGRIAYANPYLLAEIQNKYFPGPAVRDREEVIAAFLPYVQDQLNNKVRLNSITRHILGLFQGQRGANTWRRFLSQEAHKMTAGIDVIQQALALVVT